MTAERSHDNLSSSTWKRVFPWILGALTAIMLGFYAFSAYAFVQYGDRLVDVGWDVARQQGGWYVVAVDADGPAAGLLEVGDKVAWIHSGEQRRIPFTAGQIRPGAVYAVELERGGETRLVTLTAPETLETAFVAGIVVFLVLSLAFFGEGLLLGFSRPDLWVARLGSLTFVTGGLSFLQGTFDALPSMLGSRWESVVYGALTLAGPIEPALVYHFFMRFPKATPMPRGWELLKYVFYAVGIALVVPNLLVYMSYSKSGWWNADVARENSTVFIWYFSVYRAFAVAAIAAGFAAILRNFVRVTDPDQRRRLRWVVVGSAVACVPYTLLHVADFLLVSFGGRSLVANSDTLGPVLVLLSLFLLIPLTFGFTILRHQVFDINVAVRLGVRYLFARGVLEAIVALPIALHVIRILKHPEMPVGELLFGSPITLTLIIMVAVGLKLRARLRQWVDKKFFRTAYDSERVLLALVDEIKQQESPSDISRRVSTELEAALHPRRIVILYRDDEQSDLTVGYSSGEHDLGELRLSSDAQLLRVLEGETHSHDVAESGERLPDDERELLARHGITLVVPMTGTDHRLCGLLLLGEKRSEEPYSARDRAMLESIAAQMAIVYENTQLKSRVARDHKIRVEVLGRMDRDLVNLVKECPTCGACYDSSDEVCASDGAELTLSLPVERTIEGKYRLERLIGKGGMGAVYEGTDLRLGRRVAIKILTGSMFGDKAALRRFEREAQASARLSHPNIVRVYDYGAIGESGAFLVMELLAGRTLRAEMHRVKCMQPADAVRIFGEVFDGVTAAHDAGVIHRDLKPENILLAQNEKGGETVKLLDFGLAKMRRVDENEATSLTVPGAIMGTFGYMSPEQLSGSEVDERGDLFSLGVIVYEALVGRRPYMAKTWVDLIAATTIGNVRLPGDGAAVRRLERVIKRCLAGNAPDRYPTVVEARQELLPAILDCPPFGAAAVAGVSESDPTKPYRAPS